MNRPIRYLAIACLVMFVALVANVNYVQFVQADSLNDKNGNRRVIDEEYSRDRGADPGRRQDPSPRASRATTSTSSSAATPTAACTRP